MDHFESVTLATEKTP